MPNNEGIVKCGKCKEDIPADGDHAKCRLCQEEYHFDDCSIKQQSWKSLGKVGQNKWICATCRRREKPGSQSVEDDSTPLDIMAKLDSLLEMKTSVNQIKVSLEFLSDKYDEMLEEVKFLRQENKEVKNELKNVNKRLDASCVTVKLLTDRMNELEQYGRRVNLEIQGVSVRGPKLEEEDTTQVVKELADKIGVTFVPAEIHKLHRLQKRRDDKPPSIIVQFMSSVRRDAWLKAGKRARLQENNTGNRVYFNENLTLFYKGLLKDTKDRAKVHRYDFVWFQNGKILVKKNEKDRQIIVIKNHDDVNKIGM